MAGFYLVVLGTAMLLSRNTALIYKVTYGGLVVLLAIAPPIIGVGARIVRNKPLLGSSLMVLSDVAIILCGIAASAFLLPFGFVLIFSAAFFTIKAVLGAIEKFQTEILTLKLSKLTAGVGLHQAVLGN